MLSDKVRLLNVLNEKKEQVKTQREIAKDLEISLGKVNSLLKLLIKDNLIIIDKLDKKNKYKLTKLGIKDLTDNIKKTKKIRVDIHDVDEKTIVKEAVILGAGYKKGIDVPLGFIEIDGEIVIEKMIKQLRAIGIEKIIIVVGYKKEYYLNLVKNNPDIKIIVNDNFDRTGSMKSLSLCANEIKGDFILIESDLVFEDKALINLMKNKNKDCVLITKISGSGHEVFIEVRDNHLFKFSKDIHDFNKINGEIIGITKISQKLYGLMLDEFSTNLNLYINYEHTMLDVTRHYKVPYEYIDNLNWMDISLLK